MAIGPIEMTGAVTRAQDYTQLKHNEDQKGMVNQSNFQTQMEKEMKHHLSQVRNANNADKKQDNTDAKNKGNGQYFGDGGKNRKKNAESETNRMVSKSESRFDISI